MAGTHYQSVDDYIAAQPGTARPVLRRVRATIRKALPGATDGISYQIPVFRLGGAMVIYFAGYREHLSLYPATPRVIAALGKDAARYLHSKATLRFALSEDIPSRLIARVAKVRAAEVAAKAKGLKAKGAKAKGTKTRTVARAKVRRNASRRALGKRRAATR